MAWLRFWLRIWHDPSVLYNLWALKCALISMLLLGGVIGFRYLRVRIHRYRPALDRGAYRYLLGSRVLTYLAIFAFLFPFVLAVQHDLRFIADCVTFLFETIILWQIFGQLFNAWQAKPILTIISLLPSSLLLFQEAFLRAHPAIMLNVAIWQMITVSAVLVISCKQAGRADQIGQNIYPGFIPFTFFMLCQGLIRGWFTGDLSAIHITNLVVDLSSIIVTSFLFWGLTANFVRWFSRTTDWAKKVSWLFQQIFPATNQKDLEQKPNRPSVPAISLPEFHPLISDAPLSFMPLHHPAFPGIDLIYTRPKVHFSKWNKFSINYDVTLGRINSPSHPCSWSDGQDLLAFKNKIHATEVMIFNFQRPSPALRNLIKAHATELTSVDRHTLDLRRANIVILTALAMANLLLGTCIFQVPRVPIMHMFFTILGTSFLLVVISTIFRFIGEFTERLFSLESLRRNLKRKSLFPLYQKRSAKWPRKYKFDMIFNILSMPSPGNEIGVIPAQDLWEQQIDFLLIKDNQLSLLKCADAPIDLALLQTMEQQKEKHFAQKIVLLALDGITPEASSYLAQHQPDFKLLTFNDLRQPINLDAAPTIETKAA